MIVHTAVAPSSKVALRHQALTRRDHVAQDAIVAAGPVFARRGLDLAKRLDARIAAAYWPVRSEAPALDLLAALHEAGLATALPAMAARGAPLVFRRWQPGAATRRDPHGIPGPLETAMLVAPDLLFVPLAAFDRKGHRIGSGAGYYDRALERLRRAGSVHAVGLAFSVQEVERVPHEPHDQRLDYVITERALIDCSDA